MDALEQVKSWLTLCCSCCGKWETGSVFELRALGWSLSFDGVTTCRPCRGCPAGAHVV